MLLLDVNADAQDSSSIDSEMESRLHQEIKQMRERDRRERRHRDQFEFEEASARDDNVHSTTGAAVNPSAQINEAVNRERMMRLCCLIVAIIMGILIIGGAYKDKIPKAYVPPRTGNIPTPTSLPTKTPSNSMITQKHTPKPIRVFSVFSSLKNKPVLSWDRFWLSNLLHR